MSMGHSKQLGGGGAIAKVGKEFYKKNYFKKKIKWYWITVQSIK